MGFNGRIRFKWFEKGAQKEMKWTCCKCGGRNSSRYRCSECGAWNASDFVCTECGALNDPKMICKKCGHECCGYCETDEGFTDIEEDETEYEDLVKDNPEVDESIHWY